MLKKHQKGQKAQNANKQTKLKNVLKKHECKKVTFQVHMCVPA